MREIVDIVRLYEIVNRFKEDLLEFDQLFPKDDPAAINVLGRSGEHFFLRVGDLYWEKFLLTIAKLLDPESQNSGKNQNLTLYSLLNYLKGDDVNHLRKRLGDLKLRFGDVIQYRKKYLAHLDYDFTIGTKSFDASTHFEDVEYFLNEVLDMINFTLEKNNLSRREGVNVPPSYQKGANELIKVLKEYYEIKNSQT